MQRILLIEDDPRLAAMVSDYLGQSGFRAVIAVDGAGGLARLEDGPFDALVLDLMLPDMDGLEVCRRIRANAQHAGLPILMLTARGDATDRVIGLELGADDYLPKPFEPRELLARLRAILRRAPGAATNRAGRGLDGGRGDVLSFGRLEIDRGAREVRVDGAVRELTSYQFTLLAALAGHPGRVLSREAIMELVKGEALEAFDRSIDVQISRIRQAIEDDAKKPRRIITVRGSGYVFAKVQP